MADGWKKWWRTIENGAQSVSQRMVELAEVEPGQRVLDIATGIGEPALLAASRVGSSGRVVATDLFSRMLAIARERAAALGLTKDPSLPASVSNALEADMIHAGFSDVRVEEMTLALEFRSAEDCMQYFADVSPDFAAMLADKWSAA